MTANAQLYLNAQATEYDLAKAREVLTAYDKLVDSLRAEIARLQRSLYVEKQGWSTEQSRIAAAVEAMRATCEEIARDATDELAARDAEIERLGERLKQAILSNSDLIAEVAQLRAALPALWGQYDDEGRKLWIDPAEAMR